MPDFGIDGNHAADITATVVGLIAYAIRTFIRKKKEVETKTDISQETYIETLREDNRILRDEISVMARERNDALSRVGALEAKLSIIEGQCEKKVLLLNRCPVISEQKI